MTAGSGLVHAEVSPDGFMRKGGPLEILQLWVNLPPRLKMTTPRYIGLQQSDIPAITTPDGKGTVHLTSGEYLGQQGAMQPLLDIFLGTVELQAGGKVSFPGVKGRNVFLYVVRGEIAVTGGRNPFVPLLRYRTGDWGRLDYGRCPCGDRMPRLLDLEGRPPVVFRRPDGSPVRSYLAIGTMSERVVVPAAADARIIAAKPEVTTLEVADVLTFDPRVPREPVEFTTYNLVFRTLPDATNRTAAEIDELRGQRDDVIPERLLQREVGHRGLTELHVVSSMHERKALMADLADGFAALPGGFGITRLNSASAPFTSAAGRRKRICEL